MSAPPPNSSTTEALAHHIRNGGELTPQASQLLSNAMRLLDESEARFKALFSSTDEGYCFCEIVYSPSGRPVDFRFLEMNIRFEELTGLSDLVGKQAYQVFPDLHFSRLVEYGRVAVGGKSIRYEKEICRVSGLKSWFCPSLRSAASSLWPRTRPGRTRSNWLVAPARTSFAPWPTTRRC